jgi:hypothetical protein
MVFVFIFAFRGSFVQVFVKPACFTWIRCVPAPAGGGVCFTVSTVWLPTVGGWFPAMVSMSSTTSFVAPVCGAKYSLQLHL